MFLRTCLFWYIIIIIINYWACFNSTSLAIYLLATMQEPTHENKVTAVNTNNNIQANVYEPFKSYIDATNNYPSERPTWVALFTIPYASGYFSIPNTSEVTSGGITVPIALPNPNTTAIM